MNRKLWVALAVVIVAGLVGWWWLQRSGTPAAPAVGAGSAAPPPRAPEPPRPRGEVEQQPRVVVDDDPTGALRLEGQVIDADDQPVAGAKVTISSRPARTAVSEADGGFAFDALVGRTYTLIARAPHGVAGPITARLTEKSPPVIMKLRPASTLTVTVTSSDGKAVHGGHVELRGVDERQATVEDKTAVFSGVIPGTYQLAAWADGMARTFQWIRITADAEVKLILSAGAPVAGRVVDDRGAPVARARVTYTGPSEWSQQASARLDSVTSAADGTFRFAAMPAGSFRFVADHPDRAPGTSTLVALDGKTATDGVVITMAAGATVSGRVVDANQQPVSSARIRIGVGGHAGQIVFDAPREAYSNDRGEFTMRGLPRRPLAAVALHEQGASSTTPVDTSNGDVANVVLKIEVTESIAGIVVDPQGQPLEGIQVSAGLAAGASFDLEQWRLRGFPEDLTDSAGAFTLTGLARGKYEISAALAHSTGRGQPSVEANTGDTNVKIVLQPEGGVKGTVAFADGTAPPMFTIGPPATTQTFSAGGGTFQLDGMAPRTYELTVRGPTFQTRTVGVTVVSGKITDIGTITVTKGRTIAGTVVASGRPVPGAIVYVGRRIVGTGTTSSAQVGPMAAGTKQDTTDANGAFSITGFGEGDLSIVAEHETLGRSRPLRLPTAMPDQTQLVLTLEATGSLAGVLRQAGKPTEGMMVACQPTSSPGSTYTVTTGPDGSYRFDRLAPGTYNVSATVGMPMTGLHFYSKQAQVPAGQQVTVDLDIDPGTLTFSVTLTPRTGTVGMAIVWLLTGSISATTNNELAMKVAAAGPSASQWMFASMGTAKFTTVSPGAYSICAIPFPVEVKGMMMMMGYRERHGDSLPAFCKAVTLQPAPDQQAATIAVDVPAFVSDDTGSGSAH